MTISCFAKDRKDLREIEQMLFYEATLLDERRFEDWLDLMTDDLRYWMPSMARRYPVGSKAISLSAPETYCGKEFSDEGELAAFDDNKDSLTRRVTRFGTGMAWSEDPPSSTCRLISNVQIKEDNGSLERPVTSNCLVYRTRGEYDQDMYVASRHDMFRRVDSGWKIACRKILLPQNVISAKNLSIFF